jgi:hypothetical protein
MSRRMRIASALAGTTAAAGLAIAAPAMASASTTAAPASTTAVHASTSTQVQAGLGFYRSGLTGESIPLYENTACAALPYGGGGFNDSPLSSFEVTDGKSTITFYQSSDCQPGPDDYTATPGHPVTVMAGAGASGSYSATS